MTPTISRDLTDLVARVLRVDAALVSPETRFVDLGRTSFAELELLTVVEDHFRITLDAGAYLDLETVGALADAIGAATGGGSEV